jgi:predicted AlkP superfamily pyrophosphatase or phosphodiesterase
MEGLEDRDLLGEVHLLIVSDHGMSALSSDRIVYLDDYIDLKQVDIIEWTPILFLRPHTGKEDEIYSKLEGAHPKLRVHRKGDLPERLHFDDNSRITPIIGIAEDGWTLSHRGLAGALKKTLQKGTHGYDNTHPSMRGIFYASGPRFVRGATLPPLECIHLYSLMSHLLEIEPAPHSGDLAIFESVLIPPN